MSGSSDNGSTDGDDQSTNGDDPPETSHESGNQDVDASGAGPSDTMRGRVGNTRTRWRLYVQLNVHRIWLTFAVAVGFFLFLLALGVLDSLPVRQAMLREDPVDTVFQAMLTAIVTGVTLVVTLNQLVLSQELGPLGDQRERMNGAMEFRRDVEDFFGTTSPPEPASFLEALVDNCRVYAEDLRECVEENKEPDGETRERIQRFLDTLVENAETVSSELEGQQFGRYQVVKSALDFNYSWKIYQARRLRQDHADDLSDVEEEAFDDLIEVLTFFGPAREHIKTLFFQWELVGLSRKIVYLGIPALGVAAAMVAMLDPTSFPGVTLGIDNVTLVFSAAVTVCSLPFFLLATYILRLATIARRTLAIGPFILRQSGRDDDIEWG